MTSELNGFVSKACGGERCHCGEPAVRKVGEEILFDDPMPRRHNLTAYICARHYAELMGPLGAQHVGYTRPPVPDKQLTDVVEALSGSRDELERGFSLATDGLERLERALKGLLEIEDARIKGGAFRPNSEAQRRIEEARTALASLNTAPAGDDVIARALAEADGYDFDKLAHPDCLTSPRMNSKGHWLHLARAALKATTHTEEKA